MNWTTNMKLAELISGDNLDIESLKLPIIEAIEHYKSTVNILKSKSEPFGKTFDWRKLIWLSQSTLMSLLWSNINLESLYIENKVSTDEIWEIVVWKDDNWDDITLKDIIIKLRSLKNDTTIEQEKTQNFVEDEILQEIDKNISELNLIWSRQKMEISSMDWSDKIYPLDILFEAIKSLVIKWEDVWKLLKTGLIKDLWSDLYNIWDKIIYDRELMLFYKITKKLSSTETYILEWIWTKWSKSLIIWNDIYNLREWSDNIYKAEFLKTPINLKSDKHEMYTELLILIWEEIYKIDKEYEANSYIRLSKDKESFIYDKSSKFLTKVDLVFDTCIFNWDSSSKSQDLVLIDNNLHKSKILLNLETWVQTIYSNTDSLNTRYYKDQRLLLNVQDNRWEAIFNSSVDWKKLWQWKLIEKDKISINYWDYSEQLKNINISIINSEDNIKVIFTRNDWEQRIQNFSHEVLNENWTINININEVFVNFKSSFYNSNKNANYKTISFELVVNNSFFKSMKYWKSTVYKERVSFQNKSNLV